MTRSSAALTALCVVACGENLSGLVENAERLALLRGRLVDTQVPSEACNARAGLLWAATPVFVPFCHKHGPNPLDPDRRITGFAKEECRDPLEFIPRSNGPSVPLAPLATDFEIPIYHLPDAAVLAGPTDGRVGYAALIVYEDFDGNEELTFSPTCARGDEDPGGRTDCNGDSYETEKILASSFVTLRREQTRITYVEGSFDAASNFYPHPGCDALPGEGFSIWTVAAYGDSDGPCRIEPIDATIELRAGGSELYRMTCPQRRRDAFPNPPDRARLDRDWTFECVEDEDATGIVVSDTTCACPNLRFYTRRGCFRELECTTPDWDLPPVAGWPCL